MKGKIIKYAEEKGFGFILDEKASKRFFHISDTLNPLEIKEQLFVEFEPHENEKGLSSKQIKVIDKLTNTRFIKLYGTNIKCSNIKQFGISQDTETFYRRKSSPLSQLLGVQRTKLYRYDEIPESERGDGIMNSFDFDEVLVPYDYLYITTYQGDNYSWIDTLDSLKKNLKSLEDSLS